MKYLILMAFLFQLPGRDLPPNVGSELYGLAPGYEEISYKDTVVLPQSFWSLFGRDVHYRVKWTDQSIIVQNGISMPRSHYPGEIQNFPKWPKCSGVQTNYPQGPFRFENTDYDGVTIVGKAGMRIEYTCQVIAKRKETQ